MKFCSNCGTRLEDDAVFCQNCGTRSEATINGGVQTGAPKKKPVGLIVGIVVAVLVVLGIIGSVAETVLNKESTLTDHTVGAPGLDEAREAYRNDKLGLMFALPSGWRLYGADELEAEFGDDNAAFMRFVMAAENVETEETLALAEVDFSSELVDAQTLLDAIVESAAEEDGISILFNDKTTTVAGRTFAHARLACEFFGQNGYLDYYVDVGDEMTTVLMGVRVSEDETNLNAALAGFDEITEG